MPAVWEARDGAGYALQPLLSRRHQSTRYCVDNACAHCFGCHQYLGGNPIEFQEWIRQYLGDTRYEMLRERHNQIKKWLRGEKDEMNRHYKAELKRIQELRMQGEEGVLHVVDWE